MTGPKTFAFAQQKGGTGKTISVCWLAWLLARNHRVVVIDLDPQGAATALLESSGPHLHGAYDLLMGGEIPKDVVVRSKFSNCMLVPATDALIMAEMDIRVQSLVFGDVRKRIAKAFQSFDYVLIDCSGGLGILNSLAMSISDTVLMPLPEGVLEERALHATYRHMSRMRRDVADVALALPIMRQDGDASYLSDDVSEVSLASVMIPYDDSSFMTFEGLSNASEVDNSNPTMAAYFALIHELEGNERQSISEPDEEAAEEIEPSEPSAPPAPSRRRVKPRPETMSDIFDALHEKRSRNMDEDQEPEQSKRSKPKRSDKAPDKPATSGVLLPHSAKASTTSAPPTYQSLRDIHNDTLEEAPKIRTWFWVRLGIALIGIGVATIGLFTNLIGPIAMWGAVIAVLILIVPDLILRFVLRDR